MKRLFILASAAIVALASCSKTQVVYNDAPEEIGFKAVTGVMTKAEQITTLNGDMGAYAFVNGGSTQYFSNVQFTQNGAVWTGNQYWPFADNLDFVVYSPWANTTTYDTATKELTVTADNSSTTNIEDQTDYLYGADYFDNDDAGFDKSTESVPTALKHALAKVTLHFTGANVTVKSVTLEAPCLSGAYVVDYSAATPKASWTTATPAADVELSAISDAPLAPAVDDDPLTGEDETAPAKIAEASIMVVPADDSDIIISYQIDGSVTPLSKTIELNDTWDVGVHYKYNITISPNEIKFSPSVNSWDSTETIPVPVQ